MGLTVIISHEKMNTREIHSEIVLHISSIKWHGRNLRMGIDISGYPEGEKVGIRGYGRCKSPVQTFAWTGFFADLMAYTKVCFLFLLLRVWILYSFSHFLFF